MLDLAPDRQSLDPIEIASRDEIEALQLSRLKWSLTHAFHNVPHYAQAFADAGIHPDDLNSLADIRRFPFTQKADLRRHYPFGMFAVPRDKIMPHPAPQASRPLSATPPKTSTLGRI
jgi:phenylacetate-CoA ligase